MIDRRTVLKTAIAAGAFAMMPRNAFAAETAASAGYFYPAEDRPHERTFMQWPVNPAIHDDKPFLEMLQKTIADIANRISDFEPLVMLMAKEHEAAARKLLAGKVEIWDIPTDDLWCRDSGPSFVIDGKGGLAMTNFNFNGWGNKQVHDNDGRIAQKIADRLGLKLFDAGLIGEAGGVETDGEGMLIAHASSWVNPNRNSGSQSDVAQKLMDTMGAEIVVWAPGIKDADITDYHIDALARFTQPGRVIIQLPDEIDENDPWSRSAFETYEILEQTKGKNGNNLELVIVPEPTNPRIKAEDFVASYVNYYVCNGAVIASEFGDTATDKEAADLLAQLYPGREIIMLNTDPVGEVGGGIHCATHEQPKA